MNTTARGRQENDRQNAAEQDQDQMQNVANTNDAVEDDGSPVLDEIDLEENGISEEEADNIEWDDAK